jgi:hypothetical protein
MRLRASCSQSGLSASGRVHMPPRPKWGGVCWLGAIHVGKLKDRAWRLPARDAISSYGFTPLSGLQSRRWRGVSCWPSCRSFRRRADDDRWIRCNVATICTEQTNEVQYEASSWVPCLPAFVCVLKDLPAAFASLNALPLVGHQSGQPQKRIVPR